MGRSDVWRFRLSGPIVTAVLAAGLAFSVAGGPAQATTDVSPYDVVVAVDENPDPGIFEMTMVADELDVADIGDGRAATGMMAFNGTVPGPEIRVEAGDRVRVHFKNQLDHEDTGIHWHGIELPNGSDGTPLTQNQVDPGEEYLYDFIAPRPGVYWYHPHHHTSTNQVVKGMFGSLIVTEPTHEDPLIAAGVIPGPDDTHTLLVSDLTICKDAGSNDAATFPAGDPSTPWAGDSDPSDADGEYPGQQGPHPIDLCEDFLDEDGNSTGLDHAASEVPNVQPSGTNGRVNEGQTVLTNGVAVGGRAGNPFFPGALDSGAQTLPVTPGEGVRLQVVAPTQVRFLRLRLTLEDGTHVPLMRIGGEGGLLNESQLDGGGVGALSFGHDPGEILLGPGDRADVVAAFPSTATGVATLWTRDVERTGQGFADVPTVPVAHFEMQGDPAVTPYTLPAGTPLRTSPLVNDPVEVLGSGDVLLDPATFSPAKDGMADPALTLTLTGSSLGVNDQKGSHDFNVDYTAAPHELSARYAELGGTLELQAVNATTATHPFHLHGFSIQPVTLERDGDIHTFAPEFVDNINIPPGLPGGAGQAATPTVLTFRIHLEDRLQVDGETPGGGAGRWVFHCHIFFHAVFGMISEFVVTDAAGNERPTVDTLVAREDIFAGDPVTVTGTYADLDGDPVTLSLTGGSPGTLTDHGDGTWTWEWDSTGASPGRHHVYVKADDGSLTGVKVFDVDVVNPTPVVTIDSLSSPTDEGGTVDLVASFTDVGNDSYTVTVDWGDGNGPVPADADTTVVDATPPDEDVGTITTSHVYGDDGTFDVTVAVHDGHSAGEASSSTTVDNVAPGVTIDTGSTETINGIEAFFVTAGDPLGLSASLTDPGSDDLASTWDLGDGTTDVQVSLNDPAFDPDPDPSPTVEPRSVDHDVGHTYADACVHEVAIAVEDDDGGVDDDAAVVVALGDGVDPGDKDGDQLKRQHRNKWRKEFKDDGEKSEFEHATLHCYLELARTFSTVFDEEIALSTFEDADLVLHKKTEGPSNYQQKVDAELLAAWLNFAHGLIPIDEFVAAVESAEQVRLDPASTKDDLNDQYKLLKELNKEPKD